jgi:3-oxoacyl-[acyl-carrier protein] reductase
LLSGKRILVTGANSGIGFSICELLLKNNAKLVLFYHKNNNQIEKLHSHKNQIESHQVNLLVDSDVETAVTRSLQDRPIDGFIHSVSHPLKMKSIGELDWKDYQTQIDLQAKSFFSIVSHIIPSMKSRKHGKIISIMTSATVGIPPSNMSDYVVGKYSLLGLSKAMAVELGRFNITVNCISPSVVDTNLTANMPAKFKEFAAGQSPTGKLVTPSDVASVALFLCSEKANSISGENIVVDGGPIKYTQI